MKFFFGLLKFITIGMIIACIHFRRRCSPGCIFAPHFPSTEPDKFEVLHRHFGARNVAKFLKKVEDNDERAQAIESMYFEALTRREDPVHGCSGLIAQLEQQISETEAQIARTHEAIAFYAHQADQGNQPQQSKASSSKSHQSEEPKAFSSKSHQSQQSKASSSKSP